MREFVGKLLPAASEADELIALGDEASLRRALEIEPDRPEAVVGLAEMLVARGEPEEALSLLAKIPDVGEARRVAALARLAVAGTFVPSAARARIRAQSWKGTWTTCSTGSRTTTRPGRNLSTSSRRWTPRTRGGQQYRRALASRLF